MPIKIIVGGLDKLRRAGQKFSDFKKEVQAEFLKAANRYGLRAISMSKEKYLTGPRPERLGVKTGLLRSSIRYNAQQSGNKITVIMGTSVPYAAIHEYGGKTAPSIIVPKKSGGFLAFKMGGKTVFAKKVMHPGSVIKARPFLRPPAEKNIPALKADIRDIFRRFKSE